MNDQETLYAMALTRISSFNFTTALALYRELGSAKAIYDHRNDIDTVVEDCSPRFVEAVRHWDEPLQRAETELEFCKKHAIEVLPIGSEGYPQRLVDCADAPIVLYYRGSATLNTTRVVSIVGTRHCTVYGRDLVRRFVEELRQWCPQVLIVSGLAYGIDICAHREALTNGFDTVGVLAHGLDTLYPSAHRDTAKTMLSQGGLLTEFMSMTKPDKANFVRRNRIVAGIADATLLVESASKGGGLITTNIAHSYGRDVFAFPGAVNAPYSEGCNRLIRDNGAALITCAEDLVMAMRWDDEAKLHKAKAKGIERTLFPELDADEQTIVTLLGHTNDLPSDIIATRTSLPINKTVALLFQLEMKGVVKPMAGGVFHLLA